MAKYDVMMSCGHTQTIQLFGKMDDRRKKIAWLENHGVCAECAKAETARKHAEETAKAAEKAIAENLPELTGTEKQVNWALTIRANIFTELDKMLENKKSHMDAETLKKAELQAKAIKKVLVKFTEARFWIDNRNSCAQFIIKQNNLYDEIKSEIANLMMIDATDEICTADAVDASASAMEDLAEVEDEQETASAEETHANLTAEETEQETSDEEYHKKIMKELAEVYGAPTTLEKCREEHGLVWGNLYYMSYLFATNADPVTLEEYQVAYNDDALGTQMYNEANGIKPDDDNAIDCDADDTTVKIKVDTAAKNDSDIIVKVSAGFDYVGYLDYDPDGIDDSIELLDVEVNEGPNAFISKLYRIAANDIFREGVAVVFTYSLNSCDETISFPCDFSDSPAIKNFDDVKKYNWIFDYDLIRAINYDDNDYSQFLAEDYGYDEDEDESADKV